MINIVRLDCLSWGLESEANLSPVSGSGGALFSEELLGVKESTSLLLGSLLSLDICHFLDLIT